MPSKSSKLKASGSSSPHMSNSLPKTKPPLAFDNPHYLVVDATLPSHIYSDRSLFTTYVPSRKLHQTVFGTNITIKGIGDVHVRVVVSGKSILFRFRDSWHVPSSPHHFLSCSTVVSLGHQVMIAGHCPQMIYSHKCRLIEQCLPKYLPFIQINNLLVLKFNIPTEVFPPPQPASISRQSTAQLFFSLQASSSLAYRPFAGLALAQNRHTEKPPPASVLNLEPLSKHLRYLVVNTTLQSHIFSDHSLFTTYVPSHRLHWTVFGSNIVIEGIGDIQIRVVVSGKSILFRFHDSWHVPSSQHHFLSCSTVISLGNCIMIADGSSQTQMIFSHQKCLAVLEFPKYMPLT